MKRGTKKTGNGHCETCGVATGSGSRRYCTEHRPMKYGNRKVAWGGLEFDSQRELERWLVLRDMQEKGLIWDLQRQVSFPCLVNDHKVATYRADFVYQRGRAEHFLFGRADLQGVERVIEDAKGYRNDYYRLKARLVEACYGAKIVEV